MLRILRRRVQWTPQPIEPKKNPTLFELNFECLLKPYWFALDCKWLDQFLYVQVSIKRNFRIDRILWSHQVFSFSYHTYQTGNYMFKVSSKSTSIRCGITNHKKDTRTTSWRCSITVNLKHIWYFVLLVSAATLSR